MGTSSKKQSGSYSAIKGALLGLLVVLLLIGIYIFYNAKMNPLDNYKNDAFHKFGYSYMMKNCGNRFLNVKWPALNSSSWSFQPYDEEGKIAGTCMVELEGYPEKVPVFCIFSVDGFEATTWFFSGGGKIYHDGLGLTQVLSEQFMGQIEMLFEQYGFNT